MKKDVVETLEISCLDLLRLALVRNDQEAWVAFQNYLTEVNQRT